MQPPAEVAVPGGGVVQPPAQVAVAGDGDQQGNAVQTSTAAACESQGRAEGDGADSKAAANVAGGAAAATDIVYKKHDVLKEKGGAREWTVASVNQENQTLTVMARNVKANGHFAMTWTTLAVAFADIPNDYEYVQSTAQADTQGRQAPAAISTQPTGSTEPPNKRQKCDTSTQASGGKQPDTSAQAAVSIASRQFMVMPEFAIPEFKEPDPSENDAGEGEWVMKQETSLHPFWAVRRMTGSALALEIGTAMKKGNTPPRLNCTLKPFYVNVTTGADFGAKVVSDIRRCTVVGIINHEHILKDSELLLNIPEPKLADDCIEPAKKRQKVEASAPADLLT